MSSQFIYNSLISNKVNVHRGCHKWKLDEDHPFHGNPDKIFGLIYTTTIDTRSRQFQFKILHDILATNCKLYKWKIKASNSCSLCNLYPEDTYHLFLECIVSKNFYLKIMTWLNKYDILLPEAGSSSILFGSGEQGPLGGLVNLLLLVYKIIVFNFKINEDVNMTLNVFKNKIRDIYKIESLIAQKNNKISFHLNKWNPLVPFFSTEGPN